MQQATFKAIKAEAKRIQATIPTGESFDGRIRIEKVEGGFALTTPLVYKGEKPYLIKKTLRSIQFHAAYIAVGQGWTGWTL